MTTRLSKGRGAGKHGQLVVDQHHQQQASSDLLTNLYHVGKRERDGFGKLYDWNCSDGSVLHVFLDAFTTKTIIHDSLQQHNVIHHVKPIPTYLRLAHNKEPPRRHKTPPIIQSQKIM